METKVCARCKQQLPIDVFGFDPRMATGRKSYCTPCNAAWAKQRYQIRGDEIRARARINGQKRRDSNKKPPSEWRLRLKKYGITPVEYEAQLKAQNNKCAICKTDTPKGKGGWHVDHCHETNKFRGLLCHHCNVGLGMFKDDIDLFKLAIKYINNNRKGSIQ